MTKKIRCLLFLLSAAAFAGDVLPGSAPWDFPRDIVAQQYAELRQFYEHEIAAAAKNRPSITEPSASRREFANLIAATDTFLAPKPEYEPVADYGSFTATLVHWPILKNGTEPSTGRDMVEEFGILLRPKSQASHPAVIFIPDANESPADLAGLTPRLPEGKQSARLLAARGVVVFSPFLTQRRAFSEPWTDDRQWLFRLAYQTGHHLIGSEVQQISSAVDFLKGLDGIDAGRIAVAGAGQGGLIAFYAAALDERIGKVLVSNYFGEREHAYDEPQDRTIWRQLLHFGDAEIASLIAPRELLIEGGGESASRELHRVHNREAHLVAPGTGLTGLAERIGAVAAAAERPDHLMDPERIAAIENSHFVRWESRYGNAALEAYDIRDAAWRPDTTSLEAFERWSRIAREQYFDLTGRYPAPDGPLEARSTKIYDEARFTGYRLSVRVYDNVHAYGILLVPKDLKPGERRPVVFTQHGFHGKPEDALGVVADARADAVYSRFGLRLANRGYIVFAPMISTQDDIERDRLTRRAHLVGQIPLGIEVKKFGRVLDYLSTLPFVDSDRFAFYGLSYGGYTALWTGPGEPRFKVVISSGHFNDWDLKTTNTTQGTSFLFYPNDFDMFNFGMLNRMSHAELAMLIAPRPFMIEIGDLDGVVVAPRRFADLEMKRVEDLYRSLGIPERGQVARFHGPHKVDGTRTFAFLHRWLNWTPKE